MNNWQEHAGECEKFFFFSFLSDYPTTLTGRRCVRAFSGCVYVSLVNNCRRVYFDSKTLAMCAARTQVSLSFSQFILSNWENQTTINEARHFLTNQAYRMHIARLKFMAGGDK